VLALKEWGILSTGTIRNNRITYVNMKEENDLKSKGRGSYDYRVEKNKNLALVR